MRLRFTYMTGASSEEEVDQIASASPPKGLSEKITRPYLIVAGEDDNLSDIGFTYRHLNAVDAPKTLIIYEGANHSIHAASSGVLGPEPISTASDWVYDRAAGVPLESSHNVVDASGTVTSRPWIEDIHYAYGALGGLDAPAPTPGDSPTSIPPTCTAVTICGTSASSSSAKEPGTSATKLSDPGIHLRVGASVVACGETTAQCGAFCCKRAGLADGKRCGRLAAALAASALTRNH